MNPHTALLNRTLVAASSIKDAIVRLWLNPCGQGVVGRSIQRISKCEMVEVYPGDYVVRAGTRVTFGLLPGSGDIIGEVSFVVQPEHVGRRMAAFLSAEGKTGAGRMNDDQRAWHEARKASGAISVEVREPEDLGAGIREWLR